MGCFWVGQSQRNEETGLEVKVQTFIYSASIYCLSVRGESDRPWAAPGLLRASDQGRAAHVIGQKKRWTGYCRLCFPS